MRCCVLLRSVSVEDQPQCPGLWHSSNPYARSLSHSPSAPPPSFTQSTYPPCSLVRDGQTSPHRPRLVVSCSTCPPPSSPPPRLCTRSCSNKTHINSDRQGRTRTGDEDGGKAKRKEEAKRKAAAEAEAEYKRKATTCATCNVVGCSRMTWNGKINEQCWYLLCASQPCT